MSQAVQRLRRAVQETHMKVLSHTDDLTFVVCGSTLNDYTIKFKDDKFSCDCMDHRRRRTFCKHVYLVYMKVLHIVPDVNQTDNRVPTELIREAYASFKTRQTSSPEMREAVECPICFDALAESVNYVCRVCQNGFHQSCIDEVVTRGRHDCPMCRAEIRTGDFIESDEVARAVEKMIGRDGDV
jgi:hypothetical protein